MIDEPRVRRAPPPSPQLRAALANLRPVPTRRPWRRFLAITGASGGYAALVLVAGVGLRDDLTDVPRLVFPIYALGCLLSSVALLGLAFVPSRGQVLPSGRRIFRLALPLLVILIVLHLVVALTWPGAPSSGGATFLSGAAACGGLGLGVVALPLALALWSLRGALPLDAWRVLLAVAGAEGALGALVLHLHCSRTDALHLGMVHGAILLAPPLSMVASAVATRRRKASGRP